MAATYIETRPGWCKAQCVNCGKWKERHLSARVKYPVCSYACRNEWRSKCQCGSNSPWWKGGHARYRGPDWGRQSRAARARDSNTCQRCGKTPPPGGRALPVHHKIPFRCFTTTAKANRLSNLITLCRRCHGIVERAYLLANPHVAASGVIPNLVRTSHCQKCKREFATTGRNLLCPACAVVACRTCGKQFTSDRATVRNVAYCSRECCNASRALPEVACRGCGATFQPRKSNRSTYCSHRCYLSRGRGGVTRPS